MGGYLKEQQSAYHANRVEIPPRSWHKNYSHQQGRTLARLVDHKLNDPECLKHFALIEFDR